MNALLESADPCWAQYGYGALFAALFAESFGLPLPGETFLVASSLVASQGQMHILGSGCHYRGSLQPALRQLEVLVAGSAEMSRKRLLFDDVLGAVLKADPLTTAFFPLGHQVEVWLPRELGAAIWLGAGVAVMAVAGGAMLLIGLARNRQWT